MDDRALTIKTVLDGPVCTLALSGELDLFEAAALLAEAARVVDSGTERLVFDLGDVTFLDCAGVRALSMATTFAPAGCPVVIRSLGPAARRIVELLGLNLEHPGELAAGLDPLTTPTAPEP